MGITGWVRYLTRTAWTKLEVGVTPRQGNRGVGQAGLGLKIVKMGSDQFSLIQPVE